ncbi:hypothetical protein G647_03985 [Cladophialophora carrionii CBS 160.54]|uniref:Uncharacterized protein n=1 Tax=Cladophialophora carrionii CBS 160.54 TaxID=1279043 RepID=V9DD50_9EURO|nr:uncharacterized protein G647_03985 [Cladophialophora carrionii CBS 160.54]ETI24616.1 hypothetical protein G647_03985 [Cladophialophora carrionii CBS 160.54]
MGPSSMTNLFTFNSLPIFLSFSQYALSFLDRQSRYFDWRALDAEDDGHLVPTKNEKNYYLPPRSLLRGPFTTRKRGILIYLVQEPAIRTFVTEMVEHRDHEADANLLYQAILVNEWESTARSENGKIPLDIGLTLIKRLPVFPRGERGEKYIFEAIKAGHTDVFALLADHWLLACTEEMLGHFDSTLTRLLQTALEGALAEDGDVDDSADVRARMLIAARRRAIEGARRVIEYESEKLDRQRPWTPRHVDVSSLGSLHEEPSKAR